VWQMHYSAPAPEPVRTYLVEKDAKRIFSGGQKRSHQMGTSPERRDVMDVNERDKQFTDEIVCSQVLEASLARRRHERPVTRRLRVTPFINTDTLQCCMSRSPRARKSDRLGAADATISIEPWIENKKKIFPRVQGTGPDRRQFGHTAT
jgi:hypothetical protein